MDLKTVLKGADKQGVVTAWPNNITDDEIRNARANGYLETWVESWNPGGNVYWYKIRDKLTEKGKEALCRDYV